LKKDINEYAKQDWQFFSVEVWAKQRLFTCLTPILFVAGERSKYLERKGE